MIVDCEKCGIRYDDATRWTICPHNSLNVSSTAELCREHDYYRPCPACAALAERTRA